MSIYASVFPAESAIFDVVRVFGTPSSIFIAMVYLSSRLLLGSWCVRVIPRLQQKTMLTWEKETDGQLDVAMSLAKRTPRLVMIYCVDGDY